MMNAKTNGPDVAEGLVTTIIPVYNRGGMIGDSVQSVLDQTYRPIEILLVDDGSTDDTLLELNRLAAKHPDIIRVAHRENGGPGLARETGRLLATGEFIQYLDSDDLLLPHKFVVQVAALRQHPECGIAYCRSRLIEADGKVLRDTSKWTGRKMDYLFPALLVDRWWHTHTPLYRRELCDRIGPWQDNQPEDWDYDARAGSLQTRLVYCDEALSCQCVHDGHSVTKWAYEKYMPQEADFLPRLYDCALLAGVSVKSSEMRHFSRYAYSLSRRCGVCSMDAHARRLLELARRAQPSFSVEMGLYNWLVRMLGIGTASRIAEPFYRVRRFRKGAYTQPLSASWYRHDER